MITLEIDGKEAWYFPTSHTWVHDDRSVSAVLQKTLPKKDSGIYRKAQDPAQIVAKALKAFPHARVIKNH